MPWWPRSDGDLVRNQPPLRALMPFVMPGRVESTVYFEQRLDLTQAQPLLDDDPLYASAVLTHTGSVGLDAPFHHLYEYGTVPLFIAVGQVQRQPVVAADDSIVAAPVLTLRFALDERIADGLYCARSLELLKGLVEGPDGLLEPIPGPVAPA